MSNYIFHYTKFAGLNGILSSKSLWATNALKSKDSAEIKLGFRFLCENFLKGVKIEVINQFIKEVYLENKKNIKERKKPLSIFSKPGISEEQKSIANVLDVYWGLIDSECPDTFIRLVGISCFFSVECFNEEDKARDKEFFENNGTLPQWRHYGQYALKFNKKIILDYIQEYNTKYNGKVSSEQPEGLFFGGDVEYFYEHEAERFENNTRLKETMKLFKTKELRVIANKLFKSKKFLEEDFQLLSRFFSDFATCCFLAKHRSYKDEHEFRIINVVLNEKVKDARAVSNDYVELFKESGVIEEALEEIIITPIASDLSKSSEEEKREIEEILKNSGFKNVKVKISQIPVNNNR